MANSSRNGTLQIKVVVFITVRSIH